MTTQEQKYSDKYMAFMGMGPKKIPHWQPWSCPDAETYLTGIDYYEHPRLCRQRLNELYPELGLGIPDKDDPIPRPVLSAEADSPAANADKHTVRWGASESSTWQHGEAYFKTPEDVFRFSPLEKGDFSDWPHVVDSGNFSSEELVYKNLRAGFPADWKKAPEGSLASTGMYNTMFMWPLLSFGWELFLECCLDPRFERVMDEFAEINRRRFKAIARLPVNFCMCHDDIVNSRGPTCSPAWMHKYIFPRYEEFWGYLRDAGIYVIYIVDGNVTEYANDVIACGARGFVSEPFTDYKKIAREHAGKNLMLAGEGDNRILTRNNPDEIDAMVRSMVETSRMTGGYMMGVGNHIPWNVTPAGIKRYLDRAQEWAHR